MAVPTATLMQPLIWQRPELAPLLADLQANILKGHGRHHTRHVFFRFDPARRQTLRAALAATQLTSAIAQLRATENRRQTQIDGEPVQLLFLSHSGYRALGVAPARTPDDAAFAAGMSAADLGDPAPAQWDAGLGEPIDAMLLVAATTSAQAEAALQPLMIAIAVAGAQVVADETGSALLRGSEGIEHFGYVDGRSQPLLLDEEVVRELNNQGEPFVWNPQFAPIEAALVRDPGGASDDSYGSYLIFRKLEQNVAGFKAAEDRLADALHLMGDARALAGALIVGRFEDGTPVVAAKRPLGATQVANNFGFSGDPGGWRCPFQAHIRKCNPRGDSLALGATQEQERRHLMPRRGITYGARAPDLSDRPAGGVGLLFMAYNRSIGEQFEFTQNAWVNNGDFVRPGTGTDPVIGNGGGGHAWPAAWDHEPAGTVSPDLGADFGTFVTMKGGEYFFAPSLSFIRSLAQRPD